MYIHLFVGELKIKIQMRTTHDNVEIRIESLNERIDEIIKDLESRDNLKVSYVIAAGEKLDRLYKMLSVLKAVHVPTDG